MAVKKLINRVSVEAALLLVSGVYYPIQVLPGWLQVIGRISPATYVLDGMRHSLMDGASVAAVVPDLIPLFLIGVVSIPIGMAVFNWAERTAKKNGSLKRNG